MTTGRYHGDGPDASNCKGQPCAFCAVGMNHARNSEDVVDWWLFRCADFVFETDGLCEGPWAFFIQAMAVKSIVRNADKDRAAGASIRLEAESEHTTK